MIELSTITPNKENPREIDEEKFTKLCESIKRDSKFMNIRPIVVDKDNIIIAGNMRFRALRALEYKSIPDTWVRVAKDLTEEERRRFIVIDNVMYGYYDWDILTGQYSEDELIDWGLDLPVDPIPETDEVPPESHGFKIKCEDLDELIELRELLNAEVESKSMSFGNFAMIFKNRKP